MRKSVLALCAVSLSLCFALQPLVALKAQTPGDLLDSDEFFQRASRTGPEKNNTQKIEDLLKRMTLEEKVGQMTQLAIGMIVSGRDQDVKIDPSKLDKAICKYGFGWILNVPARGLRVDNWREIPGPIGYSAPKKPRLGIPMIYGIDS